MNMPASNPRLILMDRFSQMVKGLILKVRMMRAMCKIYNETLNRTKGKERRYRNLFEIRLETWKKDEVS